MNTLKTFVALLLFLWAGSTAMSLQEIDAQTGLIIDKGFETVKANCTVCHSAKLITQTSASRAGWKESIRWMQDTQNLWQFGPDTEKAILDYLAKNYPPKRTGRRVPLAVDDWYMLKTDGPHK